MLSLNDLCTQRRHLLACKRDSGDEREDALLRELSTGEDHDRIRRRLGRLDRPTGVLTG